MQQYRVGQKKSGTYILWIYLPNHDSVHANPWKTRINILRKRANPQILLILNILCNIINIYIWCYIFAMSVDRGRLCLKNDEQISSKKPLTSTQIKTWTLGDLKGSQQTWSPPNKLQERPSCASRMQKNLLSAGDLPRTPLEKLTALPKPPNWWLPPPPKPYPHSRPFGPLASRLTLDPK